MRDGFAWHWRYLSVVWLLIAVGLPVRYRDRSTLEYYERRDIARNVANDNDKAACGPLGHSVHVVHWDAP